MTDFSVLFLTSVNQSVGWGAFLSRCSGEESTSKLIQVVVRIQFLVVVGLRSFFPCWLSDRGHSQFLAMWSSPSSEPVIENSCIRPFSLQIHFSWKSSLPFKSSPDLVMPTKDNFPFLKSTVPHNKSGLQE